MSTSASSISRVFVSHSHQDDDFCRAFVHELRAAGVDVWYDEHNLTSGQLLTDIQRELHARPIFVPILSKAALHESTWVKNECMWAFSLLQRDSTRTFLPVTGAPIEHSDFGPDWLFLEGFKRIEAPKMLPYPPQEAARRTLSAIGHATPPRVAVPVSSSASASISATPTPAVSAPVPAAARTIPASPPAHASAPAPAAIPPGRFPKRLADLGFSARKERDLEYILPPLCAVPAGPFLMGSDKRRDPQAFSDEQPQHSVTLPAYQIARYPLTVAEYACFVRAGHTEPRKGILGVDWATQLQRLDHPVTSVTWHDAVAYAAWLAKLTGQPWRLPSEAEWEKAARGTDGRLYPWGNSFDKSRANTSESGKRTTTPAGTYPDGASPYGAQDMAGNVWEWTSSLFTPYPYSQNDGRGDLKSTENRVLRGGSWIDDAANARAACRDLNRPDDLVVNDGARLVLVGAARAGSV